MPSLIIEVAIIYIVPGYSSATVPDFHELPCAKIYLQKSLLGYSEMKRLSIHLFGVLLIASKNATTDYTDLFFGLDVWGVW